MTRRTRSPIKTFASYNPEDDERENLIRKLKEELIRTH